MKTERTLPWAADTVPLMLAPMQGLTNRALRHLFVKKYKPDVVFTEYVRVRPGSRKALSETDRLEVTGKNKHVPLVVQLIGKDIAALVSAAQTMQELGVAHLNINLGCPYGRMTNNSAGGALLRHPKNLSLLLSALRQCIEGSFSVKVRSGFDDPSQVLSLIKLFEESGIDYIVVHPRTVIQKYNGLADHRITAEMVGQTDIPVIANGDISTAEEGRRVLAETGAAGLMIGRGAIADPFIFERLRGRYSATSSASARITEIQEFLLDLLHQYQQTFCGDHQVLNKMKEVVRYINDPPHERKIRALKRSKKLPLFFDLLTGLRES